MPLPLIPFAIGAIITTVASAATAIGSAINARNSSRSSKAQQASVTVQRANVAIQQETVALAKKRDEDSQALALQRLEWDAKRAALELAVRAKDSEENRALQLRVEQDRLVAQSADRSADRALQERIEAQRQEIRAQERQEDREFALVIEEVRVENLLRTQEQRQAFEALEADKQRQWTQAIEEFRGELQVRIQGDSLAFQRWKVEVDQEFALKLREVDSQIMRLRDKESREAQRRDHNNPIYSVPDDILSSILEQNQMPLTLFFSPPVLNYDAGGGGQPTQSQFPMMERTLAVALRTLLEQYTHADRPVNFMAGEWMSKARWGEGAINQIFAALKNIPVAVLETDVEESFLHINLGFWNQDFDKPRIQTVVRRFRWQDTLGEIAKILQQQYQSQGQDLSTDWAKQEFSRRCRENLTQTLEVLHCIHVGMLVDEYFLIYAPQRRLPLLPKLLPTLLDEVPMAPESRTELIHGVVDHGNALYQSLEQLDPAEVVSLRLEWAGLLQDLADRYTFPEQVEAVMVAWLQQRHVRPRSVQLPDLVVAIGHSLIPEDQAFVTSLNRYLETLGLPVLNISLSCYQRALRHLEADYWEAARLDFDRTLSLNPHADAYFGRAQALLKLGQVEAALADVEQVVLLQPNRADAQELRGDVLHRQGSHELALASYNQAIHLGSPTATAKRDALMVWWIQEGRSPQPRPAPVPQPRPTLAPEPLRPQDSQGLLRQDEQGPTPFDLL